MALYTCPRCNGRGSLSYCGHIADGRCFACGGSGKLSASSKALKDAERAGLEYQAHCAAVEARACTPAQDAAIAKIARRLNVSPGALVATANGFVAGHHDAEFTKAAVSKAISTFATMSPAAAKALCYPKRVAA